MRPFELSQVTSVKTVDDYKWQVEVPWLVQVLQAQREAQLKEGMEQQQTAWGYFKLASLWCLRIRVTRTTGRSQRSRI